MTANLKELLYRSETKTQLIMRTTAVYLWEFSIVLCLFAMSALSLNQIAFNPSLNFFYDYRPLKNSDDS